MKVKRYFWLAFLFTPITFSCENNPARGKDDLAVNIPTMESIKVSQPMDTFPKDYLLGRFDPSKHPDFVRIPKAYAGGSAIGTFLRKETMEAFKEMHEAAKADGISLTIRSSTRNFFRQKEIWEAKWTGKRIVSGKNLAQEVADPAARARIILLYSSMPGTSRHHWGTDIDLNDFENSYFESGKGLKEYTWLQTHAKDYGFCQPYTPKGEGMGRMTGYEEEKWHWSYIPLANNLLQAFEQQIVLEDIEGFQGAEAAQPLSVIENYVSGIDRSCLDW